MLHQQHRENGLGLQADDEMEISPTDRLTYLSTADQRLEQDLPDYVDLNPGVDKQYLTLRNLGWSCASLAGGPGRRVSCGGDVIKPQVEWFDLPVGLGLFVLASGLLP